ncbi:hypothetical protein CC86DRAFT_372826 [Ophiobolus disseminans]|uniref:Pentatricopeptide repeat domain-containing protein n=1 Tax=Ophiobolus disseminans TaxID=1469910 RepID=A0A6A6ZS51_9PLEO|nr:hypothetical protein CC86DRAFT_372826 [Ophiobolus disseminans]
MPPALDRLLASPSALRLLRSIVNGSACESGVFCHNTKATRRQYASDHDARPKRKWQRWKETLQAIPNRDKVRQALEADNLRKAAPPQATSHKAAHEANLEAEERHAALIDGISVGQTADNDAARWAASLSRRERYHGWRGILAIWNLRRWASAPLPTDGASHADFLWGTFIKHPELVTPVIDHAAEVLKTTGQVHPRLYELLMSYWLPRHPIKALKHHHMMLIKLQLKALPLKKLARYASSTFKPAAYKVLMEIYWASNERDLYDETVPALADKGNLTMARQWHSLCMHRSDLPSESVADHPMVRIFTAESQAAGNIDSVSKEASRKDRTYNKELMRRLLGRDTPPVRFDDVFTARMFATKTFPPASIIKGLAMVGVNEIGPQAVLAMALRTDPLEDLPRMFEELRAAGIALQGCVYSLAIEKFALTHKWHLVRSMLDTDQHPDVFEDVKVQRKLLDFYLDQEDVLQAQRTLAIMTLFHNNSSEESWNLLLQAHIKRTGPRHITEVLQDMRVGGTMVNADSIAAIKSLLRRRQVGRKPVTIMPGAYDDVRFVTRIYMAILEFGMGPVSPPIWREIIRRFGMTGRFRELRRLLLWLLCWYAPRSSKQFADLPASPFRDAAFQKLQKAVPNRERYFNFPGTVSQHETEMHPVRRLFPPSLQQGLIIWGFRAGLLPNANLEQSLINSPLARKHYRRRLLQRDILKRKRWSIGLKTLVLLRDLGVFVHHHTVVKALQMQFIVLFGRGRSNKIENRISEQVNAISYSTYVREVNEIWGSQLIREPRLFHTGMIHDHIWHPRMRRKIGRRTSISVTHMLSRECRGSNEESDAPAGASEDAALQNLKRGFEAQALAQQPGFEWMHEASLDTTPAKRVVGRLRPRVGRTK